MARTGGSFGLAAIVIGSILLHCALAQRNGNGDNNPCISKQNCSECIRTPTCAWCAQAVSFIIIIFSISLMEINCQFIHAQVYETAEGIKPPRCNQQNRFVNGLAYECGVDYIINPDSEFKRITDYSLTKARETKEAVQIRPQRVSLKLRIR